MTDRVKDFLAKAEARSYEDLALSLMDIRDELTTIVNAVDRLGDKPFHVEIPWHAVLLVLITPSVIMVGIILFLVGLGRNI
jgi:hypothetical protein